ncbi:MAG TPA: FAD-dependent oxidoreductase [Hyphomonadaceae bacterium]|nr:FAD-dependent oxidoreductase [Hyphomonadaceae bacterium]
MARTQLFASVRSAIIKARLALPDAPPPGPRAISRRAAMALLAGSAAAACTPKSKAAETAKSPVAIVGGGTSGLVVAWRLATAGVPTEIYESSGRTGGRMYTLRQFTPEGHFCELGGELVDSNHKALIDLCGELGISIQRLRAENGGASDLYDIGGKQRLDNDLLDPKTQAGAFMPVARRIAADQAMLLDKDENWTPRAHELDAMPLSRYLDSLKGSTEKWVIDLLSLAYFGEYGIPLDQQSSLNFVDFIGTDDNATFAMFGDSDESHRIAGGSGTLPETLTDRLSKAPLSDRSKINLRHVLSAIERDGDGFKLTFDGPDGPVNRSFGRVVLALPFTKLREVKGLGGLGLSAEKMRTINELGYGANAKLMIGTSSRPWTQSLNGINTPLTGTIYSDRGMQIVWDTSVGQEGVGGVLTNFMFGDRALGEETPALETMVKGLTALSPELGKALTPNVRASFFWPNYPHMKASYAGCLVGQYTSFLINAAKTELDGRLFFAGEHTSSESVGFMNGAVDAGERVAKEMLTQV